MFSAFELYSFTSLTTLAQDHTHGVAQGEPCREHKALTVSGDREKVSRTFNFKGLKLRQSGLLAATLVGHNGFEG